MTDMHAQHLLYRLSAGAADGDDQRRASALIVHLSDIAARAEAETRRLRRQALWVALVALPTAALAAASLLGWLP